MHRSTLFLAVLAPALASAQVLPDNPSWSATNVDPAVVRAGGDVNDDGYDDLLVTSPEQGVSGIVRVWYGGPSGLADDADWTLDGIDEFTSYLGSDAGFGDVNGDGVDDVVVGNHNYGSSGNGVGRAFVFYGSASGPSATPDWGWSPVESSTSFGIALFAGADVNADGFDDLLVAANSANLGYLFLGSAGGPATSPSWTYSPEDGGSFGDAVGGGDFDSDGFDDAVFAAGSYDGAGDDGGRTFVFAGSSGGLGAEPSWTVDGGSNWHCGRGGSAAGGAGDVDGDGFEELWVGCEYYSGEVDGEGAMLVYWGSSGGLDQSDVAILPSGQQNATGGPGSSAGRDVDGDGQADLLFSIYTWTGGFPEPQQDVGLIQLHLGSSAPGPDPEWESEGSVHNEQRGRSTALADLDGNGYADVVARTADFLDGGVVFVWLACTDEDGDGEPDSGDCTWPPVGAGDDDDDDDDDATDDDDDTTSGDPVDPPDAMVGETYCLDWSTANITDPPDIATLLGIAGIDLNDYRILLNPTAVDDAGGTMDLLGAAASAGTCTQDLTLETFALDDATWTNPHFESQPTDLSFNAGPDIGTLSLLGAVLAGDFAITPSTDQIVNSSMDGWLDVSNLSGACFVLTCVTCPTGAGDCAAFAFDSAVWDATGNGPLTPVP